MMKFTLWALSTQDREQPPHENWVRIATGPKEDLEKFAATGLTYSIIKFGHYTQFPIPPEQYAILPEGLSIKLVPDMPKISFARFVDRLTPEQIEHAEVLSAPFAVVGPKFKPSYYHDLHSALVNAVEFWQAHPEHQRINVWICCKDLQSVIQ